MAIAGNQTGKRNPFDYYPTPETHTRPLMPRIPAKAKIWECAAGSGHMSRVLMEQFKVVSTDVEPQAEGIDQQDFLTTTRMPRGCNAIVTNPPFKLAVQFILHGLLTLETPFLALLLPVQYLGGQMRRNVIFKPHPPSEIMMLSARMQESQFNHCWYIWDDRAPTTFSWE